MEQREMTWFYGDIGPVKYRFTLPWLSYENYSLGSTTAIRSWKRSTCSKYSPVSFLVICAVTAIGLLVLLKGGQLLVQRLELYVVLDIWLGQSGRYWLLYDINTILLVLAVFFAGFVIAALLIIYKNQRLREKIYQTSRIVGAMGWLELGENGLRFSHAIGSGVYSWQMVSGLEEKNDIRFLILHPTNFIWLPDNLSNDDQHAVTAFVRNKIASNQPSQ